MYINKLTDAVDEDAGQDKVEDVEHGAAPQADDVGDVRVGFWAARVELHVPDGLKAHQVKLSVSLVVADVTLLRLFHQVQLTQQSQLCQSLSTMVVTMKSCIVETKHCTMPLEHS